MIGLLLIAQCAHALNSGMSAVFGRAGIQQIFTNHTDTLNTLLQTNYTNLSMSVPELICTYAGSLYNITITNSTLSQLAVNFN